MYCSKCGASNDVDAKVCVACGTAINGISQHDQASAQNIESNDVRETNDVMNTPLTQNSDHQQNTGIINENQMPNSEKHDSIFRKALKMDAKAKPKGVLAGMFGLQLIIPIIFVILLVLGIVSSGKSFNVEIILSFMFGFFIFIILNFILSMFVLVGMQKASLDISRGKGAIFGACIKGIFADFSFSIKVIVAVLLYSIILGVISAIPIVGALIAIALQIYFLPVLVVFTYMMLDSKCEDRTFGFVFNKSMELVKGHRVEFYGLIFSFFGWMLLAIFTLGILYFWLIPYMMISMANWYCSLRGEVSYDNAPIGLSNVVVIVLSIVAYPIIILIIMFVIFTIAVKAGMNMTGVNDIKPYGANSIINDANSMIDDAKNQVDNNSNDDFDDNFDYDFDNASDENENYSEGYSNIVENYNNTIESYSSSDLVNEVENNINTNMPN